MKTLYRFSLDRGDDGRIESVFVADDANVRESIGKVANFCGMTWKDARIYHKFTADDFVVLSSNQFFVEEFERQVGKVGMLPLEHIMGANEKVPGWYVANYGEP